MKTVLFIALVIGTTSFVVDCAGLLGGPPPEDTYIQDVKYTDVIKEVIKQLRYRDFHGILSETIKNYNGLSSLSLHDVTVNFIDMFRRIRIKDVRGNENYINTTLAFTPRDTEGYVKWRNKGGEAKGDDKFTVPIEQEVIIDAIFKTNRKRTAAKVYSAEKNPKTPHIEISLDDVYLSSCDGANEGMTAKNDCGVLKGFIRETIQDKLADAFAKTLPNMNKFVI